MENLVSVVHIITAILLISLVLLQDSKSDGLGASFGGGGSNSVLGATGATTLVQKITRFAAIIFAITSLTLSAIVKKSGSVIDSTTPSAATAPAEAGTTAQTASTPESTSATAEATAPTTATQETTTTTEVKK